ncbi:hypothetical protein FB45DRAFT_755663 [Roridomyces roridus]|uniref:Protein kinase domain-containing protein n=1 Tax=Roridomyces roridus TaxID=1738132 RepID=A0AAD7FGA1_9AGAR|nr:hypothetical protein FB45DRAFT_755663 [Roridomyces roridus]
MPRLKGLDSSGPTDPSTPIHQLPKLEEFVPSQRLPNLLTVRDEDGRLSGTETSEKVVQYRRVYPAPTDEINSGDLYLTRESRVGCGHHSNVYHASFLIPPSNSPVRVVAKVAVPRLEAREFLHHEAAIYTEFPEYLTQDFTGYALVPGLKYPVPVGAVVPKFYGYYLPAEDGYTVGTIARPSPILLLEDCGSPVDPQTLSHDDKAECFSLFLRLHLSGFLQKSAFRKNILVQPGPLTAPPQDRSTDTPSFRLIDFGRAVRRPKGNQKDWLDDKETEVKDAQKVLRIPRHSMC